ncbi:glutathione binding-like protein [Lyngbya aestuarii]|uniref:glutathione binding-like protein n=1 Tax=Lyngbya aestuarii TaxID=118322 RepID=UPI00403D6CC1
MTQPIDLYYWPTPNGWKISIMLEETETPYNVIPVDITAGDQFHSEFLTISPNNKMPAIVDPDGPDGQPMSLFESGAILIYLGEKTGHFLPSNPRERYLVTQWLMFQMGGVGPMLGQAHHFRQYAPEQIPYAIDRYTNEATRLYRVLNKQLGETEYVAGDYSIADIAIFPWILPYERQGQNLADYPHLQRWFDTINARPAVQRGLAILPDRRVSQNMDDRARENLFGTRQMEQR